MNTRLPTAVAVLSIAVTLVWLAYGAPGGTVSSGPARSTPPEVVLQERSGGSEVPCAVPLAWRMARVDPEFGISREDAIAAVESAGRLWEEGTGRELFVHDPQDGFPIRLVYDERQQRLNTRTRRQEALDALAMRLTVDREALARQRERYTAASSEYAARAADLERRVATHNAAVREWNENGDGSEERWQELEAAGEALRREQEAIAAERAALDASLAALRVAEERLNDRILEHRRAGGELEAEFPPSEVEAGEYREAVSRVDGRVESVSREIRLYRFADRGELLILAAHELGHALGLGHTDDPRGVMHASARADRPVTELAETDVALLRAVCPQAGGAG